MKCFFLFILFELSFLTVFAQPQSFLRRICIEDTVFIYADRHYKDFFNVRLADRKKQVLTKQEFDSISLLLEDCINLYTNPINEDACALFIEIHKKTGEKQGCFLSEKWCQIIDNKSNTTYKLPKNVRRQIHSIIERYQILQPIQEGITSYDKLPLNMSAKELLFTRCGPAMFTYAHFFVITFYALQDSSIVFPIQYLVQSKRNSLKVLRRKIDLWSGDAYAGMDEDGLFLIKKSSGMVGTARTYATNEQTNHLLNKYIPQWSSMTNAERMRLLDKCINNK